MTSKQHLEAAAACLAEARAAYFAASGSTPYHAECIAAAVAHERAAAALARQENAVRFGQSLSAYQRGA